MGLECIKRANQIRCPIRLVPLRLLLHRVTIRSILASPIQVQTFPGLFRSLLLSACVGFLIFYFIQKLRKIFLRKSSDFDRIPTLKPGKYFQFDIIFITLFKSSMIFRLPMISRSLLFSGIFFFFPNVWDLKTLPKKKKTSNLNSPPS